MAVILIMPLNFGLKCKPLRQQKQRWLVWHSPVNVEKACGSDVVLEARPWLQYQIFMALALALEPMTLALKVQTLASKDQTLASKDQTLALKVQTLASKVQTLASKVQTLAMALRAALAIFLASRSR